MCHCDNALSDPWFHIGICGDKLTPVNIAVLCEAWSILKHLLICNFSAANGHKTAYQVMREAVSVIYRLFSKQEFICISLCYPVSKQWLCMLCL